MKKFTYLSAATLLVQANDNDLFLSAQRHHSRRQLSGEDCTGRLIVTQPSDDDYYKPIEYYNSEFPAFRPLPIKMKTGVTIN